MKVDALGKKVKHGSFCTYIVQHPWIPPKDGVLVWDRELLCYLFVPMQQGLQPLAVNFIVADDHERTMVAIELIRLRVPKEHKDWLIRTLSLYSS